MIRNDKLGDFVLSLPVYAILKENLADCNISALVPEYTSDIAKDCQWIDSIITEPSHGGKIYQTLSLSSLLKKKKFDSVITLFSTTKTGLATLLAGIPYRLAPATKIAQIFYNHRMVQRRSRSEKPEFAYNLDLARQFLLDQGVSDITEPTAPYMKFNPKEISQLRNTFCRGKNIEQTKKLVFIHAGSGGSANNLSLEQYALLTKQLSQESSCTIVLTVGPGEEEVVNDLSGMLHDAQIEHVIYYSQDGLINFAKHIAIADMFIAGSTGPLHIAGALDIPTAGFYTRRRSATPLRWQTLNSPEHRLAFTPPETAEEMDMSTIDIDSAAITIKQRFITD